jgi:hypothetical protein
MFTYSQFHPPPPERTPCPPRPAPPGYTDTHPGGYAEAQHCVPVEAPESPEKKKLRSFVNDLYDIIDVKNNKICELRVIVKKLEHYLEEDEEDELCYEDFGGITTHGITRKKKETKKTE